MSPLYKVEVRGRATVRVSRHCKDIEDIVSMNYSVGLASF